MKKKHQLVFGKGRRGRIMIEVEVKIRVSHNDICKKIALLGFEKVSKEYEKDVYYNGRVIDLKAEDKALRIREYRNAENDISHFIMNYKDARLDESTMTRPETEFEIPDFEKGNELLNGIGFFPKGEVEKTRISYKKENITICLDNVTGLGEFIEVEVMTPDESGYDMAMGKINELLKELGLKAKDSISNSYLSMLMGIND